MGSWAMKIYFSIYILISLSIFSAIWLLNASNTKRMRNLMLHHPSRVLATMVILLSLAGLPPLIGFISKWVVFLVAAPGALYPWLAILILGSVMRLFYYLSLYFSIFLGRSKRPFLLIPGRSDLPSILSAGILLNLTGGLAVIFLNFIKRVKKKKKKKKK